MGKPCDKYPDLPCAVTGYCLGPIDYEGRSYAKGERVRLKLSGMVECPYLEQVRERWKREHGGAG